MLVVVIPVWRYTPNISPTNNLGIWVDENFTLVKPLAFCGVKRTVHAIAVFDVFHIQVEYDRAKDVANPELLPKI